MQNKWKYAALGALVGTAACVAFVMPAIVPHAWADEQPLKTMHSAKHQVLKLFDRDGDFFKPQWSVEPSVSQDVLSTQVVRKIEAGKTSFVSVVTTPSGVYSSDGLDSPHVRYPGILRDGSREFDAVAYLSDGGWVGFKFRHADSIQTVVPLSGGGYIMVGN
ncbi:MAG TPA: hypothetical protein VIN06_14685 [Devosia sp.]